VRRKHREAEQADVNLTPLLDLVFIMLIFFIVTASFVREEGIELLRPEPSQQPPSDQDVQNVVLDISAEGQITLNGQRTIDLRSIQPNVERLKAENPDAAVIVRPANDTPTGRLVSVVDMVRQAGVQDVSVVRQ